MLHTLNPRSDFSLPHRTQSKPPFEPCVNNLSNQNHPQIMSSSARGGLPLSNDQARVCQQTRKTTGLRARHTPLRPHPPPLLRPAPSSAPVHPEPSKFGLRTSSRTFPMITSPPSIASAPDRRAKKRAWINSASKHLPFTKPRAKMSFPSADTMDVGTPEPSKALSLRAPGVRVANLMILSIF